MPMHSCRTGNMTDRFSDFGSPEGFTSGAPSPGGPSQLTQLLGISGALGGESDLMHLICLMSSLLCASSCHPAPSPSRLDCKGF